MGAYHGKHGFDTFSHKRSVEIAQSWTDPLFAVGRYPPYNPSLEFLVGLMFVKPPRLGASGKMVLLLLALAAVGLISFRAGRDGWFKHA
jgi:hypothetical protein